MFFDITKETDITDNVIRSLKLDTPHVSRFIDDNFGMRKHTYNLSYITVVLVFRTFLKQSWAVEGTILHRQIENRALVYKTMVLKKKKLAK